MGLHPLYHELPVEEQARLVQAAWAQPVARLLIFDNCEDEALLEAWRPPSGGSLLLVTARRANWDPELGVRPLRLGVLDRAESVALLRRYLANDLRVGDRRAGDESGLRAIAQELGDLPLALRLAGSYLAHARRETLNNYLAQLQQPALLEHPSLQGAPLKVSATAHEQHVGRTFALSFGRLQPEHDPTDRLAVALLARAACFAPGEPLPLDLLLATIEVEQDSPADSGRQSPIAWSTVGGQPSPDDSLSRLLELGLLEPAGEDNETIRLHRLLAAFARSAAADENAQANVEEAVFSQAARQNRAGYPTALRAWDVHLRHVVETALKRDVEQSARLCNEMGYYLNMSGDLAGARPYLEQALAI
jgi:hypothetical protein